MEKSMSEVGEDTFCDEEVVFYVGQSHNAFERVWAHLLGGFQGHSIVNTALNAQPTPLPTRYAAPNARVRRPKSLQQMIHDAERALQRERSRRPWE